MIVLRILFAAGLVYAVCQAAGQLLFQALKLQLPKTEGLFLTFVTGAALVSTTVFGLAALHLIYTWILGATGLLILVAWYRLRRNPPHLKNDAMIRLSAGWRALFWSGFSIYAALYILTAMMPEMSADAAIYHVGLPVRYYEHRGFYPLTTSIFAGVPGGIEMLYLFAFAFGRHTAAAMVHLLFTLALPFGILGLAKRLKVAQAGVIAALLVFMSPVVGVDGTCAYIDVGVAVVAFAAVYLLEIWRGTENLPASLLVAGGLAAGFAYACKSTGGIVDLYGLCYVVVVCFSRRAGWPSALRKGAVFAGATCLMAAPWIVKDIIQFHNPFYPLLNSWFPNPFQYPMVEADWRYGMLHMNGVTAANIPYQLTIGGKLNGIIGPIFLLSPLALLSLRTKRGRILLLSFAVLLIPYFGNVGARFFILCLPFLALAMAMALLNLPRIGLTLAVILVLFHAVVSWPTAIRLWMPPNQWRIQPGTLKVALRRIPEQRYLEEHWAEYKPGLLVDRFVPPGARVLSPSLGQMAYQHRELLGTFDSALGRQAWDTLQAAVDPVRTSMWIREFSFPRIRASGIRVVSDSSQDLEFAVNEIRLSNAGSELPRRPSWRLSASAYPWGVQRAFDNSPVSWWTSGQRVEPGMWIGVDLGGAYDLDSVIVEQIVDQRWTKMHIEAYIRGLWRDVEAHEAGSEQPPAPDLRMQVKDELKNMGIGWVLISDSTPGADDMRNHAPYWGITQMGMANGYRLWRLD